MYLYFNKFINFLILIIVLIVNNYFGDMMLFINLMLFGLFIFFDILNINSSYIKWFTTLNNFIYSILYSKNSFILKAVFFSLIADYLLLFTDYYILGIIFFILVQIQYMKLLSYQSYLPWLFLITIFIDPLTTLALVYLFFSLANLIYCIKSKNTNMLMVITLLLCCDIIIALTYLKILPPSLCKFSWLFYFPSQYLLIKKHSP